MGLSECTVARAELFDIVLFGLPETLQTVGPPGSDSTLLMFPGGVLRSREAWQLCNE